MSARPAIVLTGFGAFPGVPVNATETLVPLLAKAARTLFPTHETIDAILPTQWAEAPARLEKLVSPGNVVLVLALRRRAGRQRLSVGARQPQPAHIAGGCDGSSAAEHTRRRGRPRSAGDEPAGRAHRSPSHGPRSAVHHVRQRRHLSVQRAALPFALGGPQRAGAASGGLRAPSRPTSSGMVPTASIPTPAAPSTGAAALSGGVEIITACMDYLAEQKAPVKPG